jgi:hypothetical protein
MSLIKKIEDIINFFLHDKYIIKNERYKEVQSTLSTKISRKKKPKIK